MTLKRLHPAARLMGNGGLHLRWERGSRDAIDEQRLYVIGRLDEPDADHEYTIHRRDEAGREYTLYYKDDVDVAYCSCLGFYFHASGRRKGSQPGTPCKHLMLLRHLAHRGELPTGPVQWPRGGAPTECGARPGFS